MRAAEELRIAALLSHTAPPYEEALRGFQQVLRRHGMHADVQVYRLEGEEAKGAAALADAQQRGTHLFLALGTVALHGIRQARITLPVVAGLVLRDTDLTHLPNASGVLLEFPIEQQLQWIQRVVPGAMTIGILYNPHENQDRMTQAVEAATRLGFTIDAQAVQTPQEIPVALQRLARVDVLLGIVDSVALTPQTAKRMLLFSFRHRIPFVGPSAAWVKAGALYALDWDYGDLGTQCGEMALRVLRGKKRRTVPPVTPRTTRYVLNHRTARHMKIALPKALRRDAHQVFD
jgi:putative ABC transport system substrate-binding protein